MPNCLDRDALGTLEMCRRNRRNAIAPKVRFTTGEFVAVVR